MNKQQLTDLLKNVQNGELDITAALQKLRDLPFEDAGIAQIDHHRELRQGMPEVIFGEGKSTDQLLTIVGRMNDKQLNILVTRLSTEKAADLTDRFPDADYDPDAPHPDPTKPSGADNRTW